jgi:hypothetical protein
MEVTAGLASILGTWKYAGSTLAGLENRETRGTRV